MAALSDLLTTQTAQQIFSTLLGYYQAAGFPTTAWQPMGVERTRLMAFSTALADVSANYIPTIAGGGYVDTASGDWLRLLAAQMYGLDYIPAGFTVGTMVLSSSAAAPTYNIQAGDLVAVVAATGNRYINSTGGTLAPSSTLSLAFKAEFAGSKYADASSSAITLVSPLPGVTISNPSTVFSTVGKVGSGTGTVTPSGTPVGSHQVVVLITASGTATSCTWSYSLDGSPYVAVGSAGAYTISSIGVTVTMNNGATGTSFVAGDTFTFSCPGSWVSTQGNDIESDAALAARCRARWASLSAIPTSNFYYLLATATPTVGSQITQVIVSPDAVISSQVNVVIAGPTGALAPATITAVQSYMTPRVPTTERVVVSTPSSQYINLAGTVTVSAASLATAQTGISGALNSYVASVGINGTVRLAAIIEQIMAVSGVIDCSGVTINGSAANLVLGSLTTFVVPESPTLSLTYATV